MLAFVWTFAHCLPIVEWNTGLEATKATYREQSPTCSLQWIHKSKWLSPNKMILSKDKANVVAEGNWEKLLCVILPLEKPRIKRNDCAGRSAPSSCIFCQMKDSYLFYHKHTHMWLCSLPSQSKCISNTPLLYCNFFHMISFPLFHFPSFCMAGKQKQRWYLVIELFFIHAVFLCKYGTVKYNPSAAAGRHRELWRCGQTLGNTQSNTHSCHIVLPFKPTHLF